MNGERMVNAIGRWLVALGVLGLVGFGGYLLLATLSSDAIGMLVGMGAMLVAVLPAALLLLLNARRRDYAPPPYTPPPTYPAQLPGPTVIVVQLPDGTHTRAMLLDSDAPRLIEARADRSRG